MANRNIGGPMVAVRCSRLIALFVVAALAATAPPVKAAGGAYNDAQLQLLFSGSRVEANQGPGLCDKFGATGDVELQLEFLTDGQLKGRYNCMRTSYAQVHEVVSGKWWIKVDVICLSSRGEEFQTNVLNLGTCWKIRQGQFNFAAYDGGNQAIFKNLKVHHPKYTSEKDLLAALANVKNEPLIQTAAASVAVPQTPVVQDARNALILPPAEYKGLPKGTKVKLLFGDGRTSGYKVARSEDYEIAYKVRGNKWRTRHAVFGREWSNAYTRGREYPFAPEIDSNARSALRSLWPLRVGNLATVELTDATDYLKWQVRRDWVIEFEVTGTEHLALDGKTYATYVVQENAVSKTGQKIKGPIEYTRTLWYDPGSGLILKAEFEGTQGDSSYHIASVKFPKGTTTHALTPSTAAVAAAPAPAPAQPTVDTAAMTEDLAAWQAVQNSTDMSELQGYLNAFPQGQFATLATIKIQQLATLSAAKQQQELLAWQGIQNSTQVADFQGYLSNYPNGLFAAMATARIAALGAQASTPTPAPVPAAPKVDQEAELWASVKDSKKAADLKTYLQKYPNGQYAAEAKAREQFLAQFEAIAGIEFGGYHALVIGNNEYKDLPPLRTAANDAEAVAKLLKEDYGFKVTKLLNATRADIIDAFDDLTEQLGADDNLLIYYAGHGWLDEEAQEGYWLPVNAKPNRRSRWLSNATISAALRSLQAKHVMVVADSCYSGTLTRSAKVGVRAGDYWKRMASKRARVAMVSGGLEPVSDGTGDNSPFATAFMSALKKNQVVMDGSQLFTAVRRPVMISAQQTPEFSDVRNVGHEGGDFLFVKKF